MDPADILDLIHDDDSGEWDAAHADLLNLSAHSSGESESGGSSMREDEAVDDDEGPPHSEKVSMMMRARDVGPGFVCDQLQEKIELLGNLLKRVEALGNDQHTAPPMELQERREEKIIGLAKLSARITTEKKNLTKVHARLMKLCSSTPRSEDEINSVLVPARTSLLSSSHSTLEVIVHSAEVEPDVVGVCVPISAIHGGKRHDGPNLEVDVISRRGLRWVKVRAASTRSLTTELQHDGDNPRDTKFVELIHEYVRRAKQTRLPFLQIPQVLVVFRCQAPSALVQQLTSIPEVAVCNCAPLNSAHTPLMPRLAYDASFVCFDATALVALTSSTCFRSSRYTVEERLERLASYKVLCEQQRREITEHAITDFIEADVRRHTRWLSLEEAMARAREMLPDALFSPSSSLGDVEKRSLYRPDLEFLTRLMDYAFVDEDGEAMPSEEVCHSEVVLEAHSRMEAGEACPNWFITDATLAEFQWILETIAGPTELRRAHMLLSCLFIVGTRTLQTLPGMKDTKDGPSKLLDSSTDLITNVQHISTSGNVSRRNRIVFGAADALHAITITSNRQVVNAARDQGIHLLVGLHPSRSLTEQKVLRLRRRSGPLLPPSLD